MSIKNFKPYTPSRRAMTTLSFDEITKTTPEKSLLVTLKKTGGRNQQGVITTRHIHITKEEREKYNLTQDNYAVKVKGEKGGILSNVTITERDKSYFEMHIDIDDANAFNLKNNDEVEIVKIMEK